jgi:general secretion pathway protein F
MMTRQLATLVGAGIPLVESVSALTEQVEKDELKKVLAYVRDDLNEGTSLAKSIEPHGHIFPPIYVNMVAAGEASGTLEAVLERLSDFMEGQARLRGKVTAALAYPVLMLGMGVLLMTMMMVVVVPKVTNIYATLDRALPWYTALLIFISNTLSSNEMVGFLVTVATLVFTRKSFQAGTKKTAFTVMACVAGATLLLLFFVVASKLHYIIGIGIGIVAGAALARFVAFLGTTAGQLWFDGTKLKLPLFGPVFRMLSVSRFSRTLATLLKSGVPLLKAMEIVRHVLDNAKLSKIVEDAALSIREGESIAGPLKRSKEFPPIVVHMIAVGEKSGQLEQMLENVARAYDSQVETRVQAMTSLLEPLIIVFMGGGVGFIAFSILMPLIQMNDFVN